MKNYDKFYAIMTMVQGDRVLIKEVHKYPYIYDQKHENYKDMKLKEEAWNKIGTAINVKPADAKNRWRNLRDRYVREKKLLLTEGEEVYRRHDVWPYLEDMSFLWDLIVHRKGSSTTYNPHTNITENGRKLPKSKQKNDLKNMPPLVPKPMQDWINSQNSAALLNINHSGECSNSGNIPNGDVIEVDPWACSINEQTLNDDSDLQPQSKLRKLLSEHPDESRVDTPNSHRSDYGSLQEMNNLVKQAPYPHSPPMYDEDQLFCLSVAASMKRFTAKSKAATKIKIQQILYDAEFHEVSDPSNETHP